MTTSVIETVGFRNKLRARWHALPETTRLGISTGIVVGLGILLFFVDHSLGYAVLIGLLQGWNEGLSWHSPGSDWTQSIVFGILILILVFRPAGLLGEQTPEGG